MEEIIVSPNTKLIIKKPIIKNKKVKYIAHRGYSAEYVDNSIEAITKAMDHPISMIETDIRLNRRGEWMIFHDSVLIDITGTKVKFNELGNKECKELDILTFEQFFKEFMKHPRSREISLYLDIKGTPNKREINKLIDLIYVQSYDYKYNINKFYMGSFNYDILRHLTDIKELLNVPGFINSSKEDVYKIGFIGQLTQSLYSELLVDFVSTDDDLVDSTYIQRVKNMAKRENRAIEIFVYVINDKRLIDYYGNLGVDGILTDDPSLCLND